MHDSKPKLILLLLVPDLPHQGFLLSGRVFIDGKTGTAARCAYGRTEESAKQPEQAPASPATVLTSLEEIEALCTDAWFEQACFEKRPSLVYEVCAGHDVSPVCQKVCIDLQSCLHLSVWHAICSTIVRCSSGLQVACMLISLTAQFDLFMHSTIIAMPGMHSSS